MFFFLLFIIFYYYVSIRYKIHQMLQVKKKKKLSVYANNVIVNIIFILWSFKVQIITEFVKIMNNRKLFCS